MSAIQEYILQKYSELEENTISANLAIPPGIGGTPSKFDPPPRVRQIDIDPSVDDTEEEERDGETGYQPSSGEQEKKHPVI